MADRERIGHLVALWNEGRARGEDPTAEDLCRDCPDLLDELTRTLDRHGPGDAAAPQLGPTECEPGDRAEEHTEDLAGFLAPPKGAEEMGRLGPFRVIKLLGAGGMGAVFQAVDEQLGRSVAVKTLRPNLATSAMARKRFLREARAAAALVHDNVVSIYHVGEENGIPYLVMPFLHGKPLDEVLEKDGRLSTREALRIGREIAEGLAEAHRHGLVHRDIKPANVWLESPRGRVKILDFGLALSAEVADAKLTQTGAVMGTPAYMPPEQAAGETVDDRGDLYSLGCVLYRMTTGRPVFVGKSIPAILASVLHQEPEPVARLAPELPPGLTALIGRLLAKDPASRPQSAGEVVEAIEAIERDLASAATVCATIAPPAEPPRPALAAEEPAPTLPTRNRPRHWAALALALVGLMGGGAALAPLIIRLKNKDGTVAEIRVPPGTKVEVEDGGKVTVFPGPKPDRPARADPVPKKPTTVAPAPVAWAPGSAEGTLPGLLPRQAHLPGLGRWQVETVAPRGNGTAQAWSSRGEVAIGDSSGTIRVYDPATLALKRLLHHGASIRGIAWDPAGVDLAVASDSPVVRVWKADGSVVECKGHEEGTLAVAWCPDGKRLASAGNDGSVRTWAADGTAGPVLKGHEGAVWAVAWSPNGLRLASGGVDKTVRTWAADGTAGLVLRGHEATVRAVAWHPTDGRLASGGDDKDIRLWGADGTSGPVFKGNIAPVTSLAWSPEGARLLSGASDATVRTWTDDGRPGLVLPADYGVADVTWSPDGRRLAMFDDGGSLRLWEADGTPALALHMQNGINRDVTWDGDGARLAVTRFTISPRGPGLVTLAADGRPGPVIRGPSGGLVYKAIWSPDGARLAAYGAWDGGPHRIALLHPDGLVDMLLPDSQGHLGALDWSPDGKRLAAAYVDEKAVRGWAADGTGGPTLDAGTPLLAVAWSTDGGRLAAAGVDGKVRTWQVDGTAGLVLEGHTGPVNALAWRPEGKILASGGEDGTIRLWDAGERPGKVIQAGIGAVHSVGWEPGGARLAGGGNTGVVRLWSAAGEPLMSLKGQDRVVFSVAWSPRGGRIASLDFSARVVVWDATSGESLWTAVPLLDDHVAVFSPGGELLHGDLEHVEKELVYTVEDDRGVLELLTHSAFLKRAAEARAEAAKARVSDAVDFAAERKGAEWLLGLVARGGGAFHLEDAAGKPLGSFQKESPPNLPDPPFVVSHIGFQPAAVTDAGLWHLAGCRRLRSLNLQDNPGVTSRGLQALRGCRTLRELNVVRTGVGDGIGELLPSWPELEVLDLLGCRAVGNAATRAWPECPRLRTLNISETLITDAGLARIVRQCPNLAGIVLHTPDGSPRTVATLKPLRLLRSVTLSADQLTDEGVIVLRQLLRLERVALLAPTNDDALHRLATLGDKLAELEVWSMFDWDVGITDVGLASVARMGGLRELGLKGVKVVPSDKALLDFARLPNLRKLVLNTDHLSVRRYTAAGVAAFRKKRPDVTLWVDGKDYPALASWPEGPDGGIAPWSQSEGSPQPLVAPLAAGEVAKRQNAWAGSLKRPATETNSVGMGLVLVPPGEFDMPLTVPDSANLDETTPRHRVRITRPYDLGATEVTRRQFGTFVEATGYKTEAEASGLGGTAVGGIRDPKRTWRSDPGFPDDPDYPVSCVTLADARAFCAWLSEKEKATYRLPTEAEWEHACRAGSDLMYVVGDAPASLKEYACTTDSPSGGPAPYLIVGKRKPNALGLFDMLGNLWEWCGDAVSRASFRWLPALDPVGAPGYSLRGSAWNNGADATHPAFRFTGMGTDSAMNHAGFRVLRQIGADAPPTLRPHLVRPELPLSPHALVLRPAPLPGLRSWSVERASTPHIHKVAWSPKGDLIAAAYDDGSVRLWDRAGRLKAILPGHEGQVHALAFSPDGRLLASGDLGKNTEAPNTTVRVWEVATGACLAVVAAPASHWCWGVSWSKKGDQLAIAARRLAVLDIETGAVRSADEDSSCFDVARSPDGRRLATVDGVGRLRFWDADSLRPLATVELRDKEGRPAGLGSVAWSPDGKGVAAGSRGLIHICDAGAGRLTRSITDEAFTGLGLAWAADGRRIAASGSGGHELRVWDTRTGKRLVDAAADGESRSVTWSPGQSEIVVAGDSGRLRIFDPSTGKELRRADERGLGTVWRVAVSPDGSRLSTALGNDLAFWDAATGAILHQAQVWFNCAPVAWSPRGNLLAALPVNGVLGPLRLLDDRTGAEIRQLGDDTVTLRTAVWSPDGARMATAGDDKIVRVWDAASGRKLRELAGHERTVWSLAWSPDGKRLASVAEDKTVRIWDPAANTLVSTYKNFPEPPQGLSFGIGRDLAWERGSEHLWVALQLHVVRLDTTPGVTPPPENFSNGDMVTSLALSADGDSLLVHEGYDWTFLRDRDGQRRLLGDRLGWSHDWMPDGRRFVGIDRFASEVKSYDTGTDRRLGTLLPHLSGGAWVCVGPDGHWRGSEGAAEHLAYVAQHDDGSIHTYTQAEFAAKFGWVNDPKKARLLAIDPR